MVTPQEVFPRTLAVINDALTQAVAEFLIGASDEEIMAIAEARNLDAEALTAKVRAMIEQRGQENGNGT